MLLISLSPGTSSLVQPVWMPVVNLMEAVFQRLEHFADQAHADINLIRADGLGNVCRVNGYLLNVQTFVLKVAVLDRDVHRCSAEGRRVDQTQVGCVGICCRGSVRIAA